MTIYINLTSSSPEHLTHPKYRSDIDGLRAVAVLLVVSFHAFPEWMKGGFIGVDIFFVISGFLISTIIFENLERNSFSFFEFYSRRIRRIFPALLLVLISSFTFGWFSLFADEYLQLGKHIAASSVFISNFVLLNESGYFDNASETKPLLHLWTLGIEEQFYIIWPLFLWGAWKSKFNLLTITIAFAVTSFILNVKGMRVDATATFYSPQTRFWELLTGSILAYLTLYQNKIFANYKQKLDMWLGVSIYASPPESDGNTLRNIQSLLGTVLIGTGILIITKERSFPGALALLPTFGTALIISAGSQAWINRIILSNKLLVWFGLISFPLYLWHWPLLSFVRIVQSEIPPPEIRIIAVFLSTFLAFLTYRFVEKPIRFGKYGNVKTTMLIALMSVVGYMGYSGYERNGLSFRENIKSFEKIDSAFMQWKYLTNDVCLKNYPFFSQGYTWRFCMASKDAKPTIVLLGNSFANHHYPGLLLNTSFKHHSILSIGTCSPEWVNESKLTKEIANDLCSGKRPLEEQQLINGIIEKSGTIKFSILDGLVDNLSKEYFLNLKKRIDFLERNNVKVIVFEPHIYLDYDTKGCFARPFKKPSKNCEMSLKEYRDKTNKFKNIVNQLKISNPNVAVFDQNILFCNEKKCSMTLNGMPLFRDINHFSEYGSIEMANVFEKWARTNVPEMFL